MMHPEILPEGLKKETRAKSGRIMPPSEHAKDALPRDTHAPRQCPLWSETRPIHRLAFRLGRRKSRPDGERLYFRQSRYRDEGASSKSVDEGYKSAAAITNFRASDLVNCTNIRSEMRLLIVTDYTTHSFAPDDFVSK